MQYPNSRAFLPIQHLELYTRFINDTTCYTIKRINLPYHCAFAYTTKAWITGTHSNIVELGGNKCSLRPSPSCSRTCLRASMATAYNYNIIWPNSLVRLQVDALKVLKSFLPSVRGNICEASPLLTEASRMTKRRGIETIVAHQSSLHICILREKAS